MALFNFTTSSLFAALPGRLSVGLLAALTLCVGLPLNVYADGAAVFASVTDTGEERRLKAKIEADLAAEVTTSSVWVDATRWTRLHSTVMSEQDARALVARAQEKGYDAWYNSSGNRWAKTADEAPRSRPTDSNDATYGPSSSRNYETGADWGVIKPATGDVSHLPMAETFPID